MGNNQHLRRTHRAPPDHLADLVRVKNRDLSHSETGCCSRLRVPFGCRGVQYSHNSDVPAVLARRNRQCWPCPDRRLDGGDAVCQPTDSFCAVATVLLVRFPDPWHAHDVWGRHRTSVFPRRQYTDALSRAVWSRYLGEYRRRMGKRGSEA